MLELSTACPSTDCLSQPSIIPTSAPHSLRAIVATAIHHFCNRPTSCHRINLFMVYLTALSGPILQFPSCCSQVCADFFQRALYGQQLLQPSWFVFTYVACLYMSFDSVACYLLCEAASTVEHILIFCWPLISVYLFINPLAPELFFLILAHSVYKMWIIQEPNKLALWNKLHFEEKKRRV